ncbi:hypothetical protein [Chryseobacterium lathyri]|uniref:Uncharacterized protein n=1 Tax=Chryseobacterium lathyri TaxID=395933 RepID=A0ABT9SRM6_9FLAO|nr:hypothetical protein [Chryseobacterium lathyri]MDP9961105.1 hypothetical protein [Chryseobacterium lathyri]
MKPKEQKNLNERKLNNESFSALRKIKVIEPDGYLGIEFLTGIINFTSVLDDYNWGFKDDNIYPNFHSLGLSMSSLNRMGAISKYQKFCIVQLSSILYDARVLYENNLMSFTELYRIVARVKKDAFKRFKSIEKAHAKKQLINNKLDSDSLLLLQAKLAILENEN